jgi:heat shock protein HtpX
MAYWSLFFGDRRDNNSMFWLIVIIIFTPIAALLVRMAISRRREYAADHSGAVLTKHPAALASALRKIASVSSHKPIRGSPATSHLWIVNPFRQDWFTGLFSTHPPLERRIAKLERMERRRGVDNG